MAVNLNRRLNTPLMCKAAWLSQNSRVALGCFTCKSQRRKSNQTISHTTTAIELYSASANDLETIFCFLDFHETKESPKKIQKPIINLLVSGPDAQSTSAKALKWLRTKCLELEYLSSTAKFCLLQEGEASLAETWIDLAYAQHK